MVQRVFGKPQHCLLGSGGAESGSQGLGAVTSRGLEGWAFQFPGPDCRLRACVPCSCVCVCACVYMRVCTRVHVCTRVCVHACVCPHMYVCCGQCVSCCQLPCPDLLFVIAQSLVLGWDSPHSICVDAGWLTAPAVVQPLSQGTKGVFVGGGFVEESRSGPNTSFSTKELLKLATKSSLSLPLKPSPDPLAPCLCS